MSPSRTIETIVRPIDEFSRDETGRPLRTNPIPSVIRIVGTAEQGEVMPSASTGGVHWIITPQFAQDSVDFQLFRQALRVRGLVAMGVVSDARPGAGAVIVVPIADGFALHAVDKTNPSGPFERLFSTRAMTMFVADWDKILMSPPIANPQPRAHASSPSVTRGTTERR